MSIYIIRQHFSNSVALFFSWCFKWIICLRRGGWKKKLSKILQALQSIIVYLCALEPLGKHWNIHTTLIPVWKVKLSEHNQHSSTRNHEETKNRQPYHAKGSKQCNTDPPDYILYNSILYNSIKKNENWAWKHGNSKHGTLRSNLRASTEYIEKWNWVDDEWLIISKYYS